MRKYFGMTFTFLIFLVGISVYGADITVSHECNLYETAKVLCNRSTATDFKCPLCPDEKNSSDYSWGSFSGKMVEQCGISKDDVKSVHEKLTRMWWFEKCHHKLIAKGLESLSVKEEVSIFFRKRNEYHYKEPNVDGDENYLRTSSVLPADLVVEAQLPYNLAGFEGHIFLYVTTGNAASKLEKTVCSGHKCEQKAVNEPVLKEKAVCSLINGGAAGKIECVYPLIMDDLILKGTVQDTSFSIVANLITEDEVEQKLNKFNSGFRNYSWGDDWFNLKFNEFFGDPKNQISHFYYLHNFMLESKKNSSSCNDTNADLDSDGISDDCDFDRNGNGIINHLEEEQPTPEPETEESEPASGGSGSSNLKPSFSATAMDWRDELRGVYRIAQDSQVEKLVNEIVKKPSMLSLNLKASNDIDNDGVANDKDKCPNTAGNHPSGCKDSDGDSVIDSDDNCPAKYNPTQSDKDSDKIGDLCDSDSSAASEISKVNSTSSASGNSDGGGSCSILNKNEIVGIVKLLRLKFLLLVVLFLCAKRGTINRVMKQ